jgi:hypothetical protein
MSHTDQPRELMSIRLDGWDARFLHRASRFLERGGQGSNPHTLPLSVNYAEIAGVVSIRRGSWIPSLTQWPRSFSLAVALPRPCFKAPGRELRGRIGGVVANTTEVIVIGLGEAFDRIASEVIVG